MELELDLRRWNVWQIRQMFGNFMSHSSKRLRLCRFCLVYTTESDWFPIWRHSLKLAAMTSFQTDKCCHLVSGHASSFRHLCNSVCQLLIHDSTLHSCLLAAITATLMHRWRTDDVACPLIRWQHFSVWNDFTVAVHNISCLSVQSCQKTDTGRLGRRWFHVHNHNTTVTVFSCVSHR